jgi:hypothetical protein
MDPLSIVALGLGTVGKLATIPSSIRSERAMRKSLDKLNATPMARYTVSPEITKLYQQSIGDASNPEGYSGAETSNFRNQLGRISRGRFRAATNASGGSGARAINSILKGSELDATSNFYAGEAGLRRSNRLGALNRSMGYANQFQQTRDRNTNQDINYRMNLENALGQGIRSQRDFRNNLFSGLGSDLITGALAYGDFSGGGDMTTDAVGGATNFNTTTPSLNYKGTFGRGANRDLMSRRNKMRGLGAYNSNE